MKLFKSNQKVYFLLLALATLSGCWFSSDDKNSDGGSDVSSSSVSSLDDNTLMTIDGKVVLTVEEYEKLLNFAVQSNQQIAMIIEAMPNGEKDFIFKGISSGRLMKAWGEKNGVDKTEEFLQEQKQAYELVDFQMYMKYYEDAHPTHVNDKELREFYEEKKEFIPALVVSAGGVKAQFVRFDTKEEAHAFYGDVKDGSEKVFVDLADSFEVTVQEALINKSSQYSQSVKKFAENVTKTPEVSVIKVAEGSYWVIQALDKVEAEYRSLESPEIKEGLRQMVISKKKEAELDKNMEILKSEMNVVENNEYFEKKIALKQGGREEMAGSQYGMDSDEQIDTENSGNISKM